MRKSLLSLVGAASLTAPAAWAHHEGNLVNSHSLAVLAVGVAIVAVAMAVRVAKLSKRDID